MLYIEQEFGSCKRAGTYAEVEKQWAMQAHRPRYRLMIN
jgi:hypothetical protein